MAGLQLRGSGFGRSRAAMDEAENGGDEEQRGEGREEQARRSRRGRAERSARRPRPARAPSAAMPMIIASAVISTGRKRTWPASSAALIASPCSASRSRAKLTTRIEFAVATPMHMIAPVSAGTDSVVPVTNSIQMIPASAAGQRGDDHERVEPALEVHHDQQVDQHDRGDQAEAEAREGGVHRCVLAAHRDRRALGRLRLHVRDAPS